MKLKKYLAGSLLALAALATACTNEEIVDRDGNGNAQELPEGAVQFKIDGINTGAVETRAAGGTVIASAQENRVDHLAILVFGAETARATVDELTFRDYWTSEKRADYICDTEKKTFALKGMGKYYTATVVVPSELKSTRFLFITNKPRFFDARVLSPSGTGTMPELEEMYKEGEEHLHVGYALDGLTYREAMEMLVATEAVDGVGVPADYLYTVPATLPCDKPVFEMQNDYFGFVPGRRETLAMTGVSTDAVTADGQSMNVTLYRNVARLDVSVDGGISLTELKLTNIAAIGGMKDAATGTQFDGGALFNSDAGPDETQSTFSLMKTDPATGALTIPARSYCYPSITAEANTKLIGKQADGTAFEIPFVDKDTKQPLKVLNNHRYTIKIRRTAENHIDANIIVEAWNVGDAVDVDLNGGDALTPAPALYDASNYQYATWEGTGKVTCLVSDNYTLNSTNPATYPWLRFDVQQMSSLGLRMYYLDSETDYPGAFFDPSMQVHNTVESADGSTVRHELMVTFPGVSTQWLKLQNNFDPSLSYVVKVETGNMEATGTNAKTPALIAFAETNVATGNNALIGFPQGGFDGPYSQPVADWTVYRGDYAAPRTINVTGYALPTLKQLQCIAPDAGWGVFALYNGVNVEKSFVGNDIVVYYSGSPLDRNVVRAVVDRTQTGADLGTASQYVNVEATLWHYDAAGYLKINTVNLSISGSDAGRLTSYTALMDLFNNNQNVSAGYTRYFPASANVETAYLGEGTCALVFSNNEVKLMESYNGNGYIRPVMSNGVMAFPAREPVRIPEHAPMYNGQLANLLAIPGATPYWVAPVSARESITWTDMMAEINTICPDGWHVPTKDEFSAMTGISAGSSMDVMDPHAHLIWLVFDNTTKEFWSSDESDLSEAWRLWTYEGAGFNHLLPVSKQVHCEVRCVRPQITNN